MNKTGKNKLNGSDLRRVCEAANTFRKDDGKPNFFQIAKHLGKSRSTVRRWIISIQNDEYPGFSIDETPTGNPDDLEIAKLQDQVRKLRKDLADQSRELVEQDAIQVLIGKMADAPKTPPDWTLPKPNISKNLEEVPVTIWSDWHYGEVVNSEEVGGVNEYNSEIAEERIRKLVESTIDVCRNHGPKNLPGVTINMLGDFISGGLHPELLRTDEHSQLPASLRVHDLLTWALRTMADEFGKVFVPCASGNHGRNTTRPEYKGYIYHNFDWLIYEILRRTFENDKRIQFMNPASNQVHYRVFNSSFLAVHGDMLGARGGDGIIGAIGPIMRGEFKTRRQAGAIGQDYDYLLMGHYHQSLWLKNAIVAGSIKGFDEYVKNDLRGTPETPSQPLFFVHPARGITSRWEIQVDDAPREIAETDWVSVFGNAA